MKLVQVVQDQICCQALILIVLSPAVILSKRVMVISYSGIMFDENRRVCGKWKDLAQVLFSYRLLCWRCWSLRVLPLLSQINNLCGCEIDSEWSRF